MAVNILAEKGYLLKSKSSPERKKYYMEET